MIAMNAVRHLSAMGVAGLVVLAALGPAAADVDTTGGQIAKAAWTGWWSTVTFTQEKQCRQVRIPADVLFGSDSAEPGPGLRDAVADAAEVASMTDGPVRVLGYLDDRGPENLPLSQARADNVAVELVATGIEPNRIVALGRGEANPVATNATASGRAQNRRVEIQIGECPAPRTIPSGNRGREPYSSLQEQTTTRSSHE